MKIQVEAKVAEIEIDEMDARAASGLMRWLKRLAIWQSRRGWGYGLGHALSGMLSGVAPAGGEAQGLRHVRGEPRVGLTGWPVVQGGMGQGLRQDARVAARARALNQRGAAPFVTGGAALPSRLSHGVLMAPDSEFGRAVRPTWERLVPESNVKVSGAGGMPAALRPEASGLDAAPVAPVSGSGHARGWLASLMQEAGPRGTGILQSPGTHATDGPGVTYMCSPSIEVNASEGPEAREMARAMACEIESILARRWRTRRSELRRAQ